MLNLFVGLDTYTGLLLLLALTFVLLCEVINGFHDTANAVATVIYTRAVQPQLAMVMTAFFNFFSVLLGGLSVAYIIVYMLPIDLLLNMGPTYGLATVFSMLLTAIIWNLGARFSGSPASSSRTLVDVIVGIGLANVLLSGSSMIDVLNLYEVIKIFSPLIVSPIVGLVIAGRLIFLLRRLWSGMKKHDRVHRVPEDRKRKKGKRKSPFWTRTTLIAFTAGVMFSHDANNGQKGIGLMMLVLVGIAPTGFVINMSAPSYEITRTRDAATNFEYYLQQHPELPQRLVTMEPPLPATSTDGMQVIEFHCHSANTFDAVTRVETMLPGNTESYESLGVSRRSQLCRIVLHVSSTSTKLVKLSGVNKEDQNLLKELRSDILGIVEYIPVWIIMMMALTSGIGIMTGWRHVTMTIGEKIGKHGMTYAWGMMAQMTAAVSIGFASYTGTPVFTIRVLSSVVAGVMVVGGGGLRRRTITNILMAWVSTLPTAIFLSGGLYWIALQST